MIMRSLLLLFMVSLFIPGCIGPPQPWNGTVLDPPQEIVDFELISSSGTVHRDHFEGYYTALVFGYTHCPDFCPTTMARLGKMVKLLESKAEKFRVALITVDPERDTPEKLATYATSFNPGFVGLTGSTEQLEALTQSIGIYSERAHDEGHHAEGHYLVNHTTSVILLDPAGDMKAIWSFDLSAEAMAADLKRLL